MTVLHPVVDELLAVLKQGPAAGLAVLVEARIVQDRADRLRDGDDAEGSDEIPRYDGIAEGLRALDMADKVIHQRLDREVGISGRLQEHATTFEIAGIRVMTGDGALGEIVDLTDPGRAKAILTFLTAWSTILGQAREAIHATDV